MANSVCTFGILFAKGEITEWGRVTIFVRKRKKGCMQNVADVRACVRGILSPLHPSHVYALLLFPFSSYVFSLFCLFLAFWEQQKLRMLPDWGRIDVGRTSERVG